ncbi:histidine phosphatase family protein [Treponema pedis]|uniref:histidine phosphatase family protein n=1 Tax=Treponema pedis TaxID=409322 RepID=UPI00041E43DA|nr:histidine phosphatase family protein [Treponema pedis]
MKTVYLLRHSYTIENTGILQPYASRNPVNMQLENEKLVLSSGGEEAAKKLSMSNTFGKLDAVYSSHYIRAVSTAKYFAEKFNLKINIDERFGERKLGTDELSGLWEKQFFNPFVKNAEGESRYEVTARFNCAINDLLKTKEKNILVVSHGVAITFFIMQFCKLISVCKSDKSRHLSFRNKELINAPFKNLQAFKLIYRL